MSCLELSDEQVLDIIEPMMADIMAGIGSRDHARHSRPFSVECKARIPPEHFLAECDRYTSLWGRLGQRELVSVFRKPRSFTCIWHQHFDGFEGEVLSVSTVVLKGGRYFVDFFILH